MKTPNKLFRVFLSILIRVYLKYFFNLLKELELNDEQAIFFSGNKFGLSLVALCMIFALTLISNSLMFFLIT